MTSPFVRIDVSLPAAVPLITAYAGAVAAMKAKPATDPTSWAYQAAIHGTYAASPLAQWNQCRHGTWYFISWHRMYLYYFERIVRAQVVANGGPRDWALPYWNYDGGSGHNAIPPAFRTARLTTGRPNPLFEAQRGPGINAGGGLPPSITSPAFALARASFTGGSEFGGGVTSAVGQFWAQTGRLEQTPHNDVHSTIGGLMGDPDTAAQDPIFWLHHANIDRIWWLWKQNPAHANPVQPAWATQAFDFVDVGGTHAPRRCSDVLDTVTQLSYTYDRKPVSPVQPAAPAQPGAPAVPRPAVPPVPVGPPVPPASPIFGMVHAMSWPRPWPQRSAAEAPAPDPALGGAGDAPRPRDMVGATDEPVTLVGNAVTVAVPIDERATSALATARLAAPLEHRAFLEIDDIEAERNPGAVYGVYINLPDDPTPQVLAEHHVGNISLFGIERSRNPRGDEHAHGLHLSMEITGVLNRLAADGSWSEGGRVDASFRPVSLLSPADGTADMAIDQSHPDLPVTLGRVSVHYS